MDSLNRNSREKGKLYAFLFFLRIICAKITFARSNNNYKLSFIHYFPNFKFLGRVYEKKMLLFLCVYLVALVLMGITIQLYNKFYLSAVDMNIPKISVLFTILILVILVLLILAYLIYRKIPKD